MTQNVTLAPRYCIAIVTETWEPEINGVAITIGKLANGLLAQGCRLQLFRPAQGIDRPVPQVDEHLLKGFTLPWYHQVRVGLPAGRYLKRTWNTTRPDAVIVVTEGPLGLSALRVAGKMKIPVISEFHTHFEKYSRYYHLGLLFKLAGWYLRWFHNQSNLTLVPTQSLKEQLAKKGFNEIQVLSRGIDHELFNPRHRCAHLRQRWGVNEKGLAVLFVGRLAPEKNLSLAIKAFREIQKYRPDARFIIVGDGPSKSRYEAICPDCLFTGMKTGIALAEHYASADLFLSPSLSETFGNTLLEEMSSQLGVVTFDYAAGREFIKDSRNGLKVNTEDENVFIKAAACLGVKDEFRKKLASNARKSTLLISWDSTCLVYLSLIQKIIAREVHHDSSTQ